jgi:phage portal protein, SPP1 family
MEEELKVNEFEQGADRETYHTNQNMQQAYGPEANFHYRANSADEILGDLNKLRNMILDHHQVQCPRLASLDNYMKARNDGIYNDDCRRMEREKADHRAAHNFAKIINLFDVGYNTGIPIKKASDNDRINELVREYDRQNDIEALDSELWRDFRKYGRAYELQYRNQNDEDCSVISNVFETFVCYGLDVERTPLFAVRYPKYRSAMEELTKVIVYTDTEIITYKPCSLSMMVLAEERRDAHYWGEVPVTEYSPDRYRQGGYEDVTSLIDLYDAAQSDTANYMTDFNEATLVISGDLDMGRYSVKEVIEMKRANLLLLANGVNPDGSKSQTDAKYVYKQYDVDGVEAYKERLQKDIHKISFVPDLTDEAFSGTQSGEAMKYKLFGFQQMSKSSQRGFKKGLMRRYRLLLNIKNYVSEADNADLGDFTITFTPNLPKAVLEELKALADAGTQFSQETLLEQASFVEDAKAEIERIQEEDKKIQETVVDQSMFGVDINGQSRILETQGAGTTKA